MVEIIKNLEFANDGFWAVGAAFGGTDDKSMDFLNQNYWQDACQDRC